MWVISGRRLGQINSDVAVSNRVIVQSIRHSTKTHPERIPILQSKSFWGRGRTVKGIVEKRAVELGEYIVPNKATVHSAAKNFGVGKSTVHTVVT